MKNPNPGWREFERTTEGVTKAEILKIAFDLIFVAENFNARDLNKPKTQAKIQAIKEAYKEGRYVKPIEVWLDQGKTFIVDGHCRFTAANLANEELKAEGKPLLPHLMCVPFKGNDIERLVHMVTGNEGESLTPLEVSEVVKRLTNQGLSNQDIGKHLNVSPSWVARLLILNNAPHAVKQLLVAEKVSVEVVLDMLAKHGEAAAQILTDMVEKVGKKITPKHTKPVRMEKQIFPTVRALAFALPEIQVDGEVEDEEEYTVTLSGTAIKALQEIQNQLTEKEQLSCK